MTLSIVHDGYRSHSYKALFLVCHMHVIDSYAT